MGRVVVLVELKWIGHYETQLKLFVGIILKWGWKVIVLCPEPQVMECWVNENLSEYKEKFYVSHLAEDKNKHFMKSINLWRKLQDCIHTAERTTGWQVDIVFLVWLDGLMPGSLWQSPVIRGYFMTYPWVGIYFFPKAYRSDIYMRWSQRVRHRERSKVILKSLNCQGIGVLDEDSYRGLLKELDKKNIFLLPDVTDEQLSDGAADQVRAIRQRAGNRPIIGLIGVLDPRKGVLNFLRSIAAIDSSQCFFLLAGSLSEERYPPKDREELRRLLMLGNNENCYFKLGYISDAAMVNSLVNSCDILYLAYEKFYYSSGLLTKAAVFKKLVIVSKKYSMAKRVEEHKLGVAAAEGSLLETVEAIKYLLDEDNRNRLLAQAEFDRYHHFHCLPMLEQTLYKMLTL